MTVRVEFDIDNAAFQDGETDGYNMDAIASTIREVALQVGDMPYNGSAMEICKHQNIRDANGNIVGTWTIKDRSRL